MNSNQHRVKRDDGRGQEVIFEAAEAVDDTKGVSRAFKYIPLNSLTLLEHHRHHNGGLGGHGAGHTFGGQNSNEDMYLNTNGGSYEY